MKTVLLSALLPLALSGCVGPGAHVVETLAAPAGAMAGYSLSGGDPLATAIGAGSGVGLTKIANWRQAQAQARAFQAGRETERATWVKQKYWSQVYGHRPAQFQESVTLYPIPVPEHDLHGSLIQATTRNLIIQK